ncbi:hypothetical protein L9F63_018737 [Diploptera punctata]|uniref:Ionotropic glutamate receptor C-terminal domain-containing protein n=1 Tax=Diploptera punctata TaxID=6984 RepID=A0AAD8EFE4_DIPPU|nr:hypothetical protein L9F63_018737 [Diploptera punctata]
MILESFPILINLLNTSNRTKDNMKCNLGIVSYIFFLKPSVNETAMHLNYELKSLKSKNCLKTRANFLIVFLSHGFNEKVAEETFTELRNWNIFNTVIMTINALEAEESQKSNTAILNFYTWFPYRKAGKCLQVEEIVKINSCFFGVLQSNVSIFSRKVPRNLHGCPITAAIVNSPLTMLLPNKIANKNGSHIVEYGDGWELQLWKILVKSLNMSEIYILSYWKFANGTANGLKDEVLYKRADVAFGSWPLLWRNLEILDPTMPVLRNGLVWLVPCAQAHPRWTGLFNVFSIPVWLFGVLLTNLSAAVLCFLAKNSHEIYNSFLRCIMNFFRALLGISVEILPKKTDLRILFLSWIIFSMCINTIFQAYLTTFLIQPTYQHQINSFQELLNSGIEFGYTEGWREKDISENQYVAYGERTFGRVAYNRDFCFLFSKPSIKFILTNKYLDDKGEPLICIMDEVFYDLIDVFYFQKGHPLLDRINSMIERIVEAGLMDLIILRSIELEKVRGAVRGFRRFGDDYGNLNIEQVNGVFFIFLIGNSTALLSFISEMLYFYTWKKLNFTLH